MWDAIFYYLKQPTTVGALIAGLGYFGIRIDADFQPALQDLVVAAATAAAIVYDEIKTGHKPISKE